MKRSSSILCASSLLLIAACGDDTSDSGGHGGEHSHGGETADGGGASDGAGGQGGAEGGGGQGGQGGGEPISVDLQFAARVGSEDAACGTVYTDLGADAGNVELADLRFYVHDIRLVDAAGEETPVELDQDGVWQVENVALLDFEDGTGDCADGTPELNSVVHGTVPSGEYVGVRYRLGVPFELNHENVATSPSPLNISTLFWEWAFGHIFFSTITSMTTGKGPEANPHFVHLGSTGCTGDPALGEEVSCSNPNRPAFAFDTGFDLTQSTIVLDIQPLLAESNLGTEIGCHSFPDTPACTAPFEALGIDYATGELTDTQSIFSIE